MKAAPIRLNMVKWLALVVFVQAGSLTAQQPSGGPHGWTTAKWGMKESAVKALFPKATMIDNTPWPGQVLGFHGFEIGSSSYTVKFDFDKNGLNTVTLSPEGERSVAELLGMLKDKYGTPTTPSDEDIREPPGKQHFWEWTFPDTGITLKFGDYLNPKYNFVFLFYHKRVKSNVL